MLKQEGFQLAEANQKLAFLMKKHQYPVVSSYFLGIVFGDNQWWQWWPMTHGLPTALPPAATSSSLCSKVSASVSSSHRTSTRRNSSSPLRQPPAKSANSKEIRNVKKELPTHLPPIPEDLAHLVREAPHEPAKERIHVPILVPISVPMCCGKVNVYLDIFMHMPIS